MTPPKVLSLLEQRQLDQMIENDIDAWKEERLTEVPAVLESYPDEEEGE